MRQDWTLRFAAGALYSNPSLFEEGNDVVTILWLVFPIVWRWRAINL
jgi:hypothetical protein